MKGKSILVGTRQQRVLTVALAFLFRRPYQPFATIIDKSQIHRPLNVSRSARPIYIKVVRVKELAWIDVFSGDANE